MDDPLHEVRIVELPIEVHARATEHLEGLAREFALIRFTEDQRSVPRRVGELAQQLEGQFSGLGAEQNQMIREAVARGESAISVTYHVPAAWAHACVHILAMLDEVDGFCRAGDLVSLATPRESVLYRRWVFGEFVRQVDGEPPLPWTDYLASAPAETVDEAR